MYKQISAHHHATFILFPVTVFKCQVPFCALVDEREPHMYLEANKKSIFRFALKDKN